MDRQRLRAVVAATACVASSMTVPAGAVCPSTRPCVAILDTGIDPAHPDFSQATIQFRDLTDTRHAAYDDFGHGTAVASRIAGNGTCASGQVPTAHLVIGKVNLLPPDDPAAVDVDAVRTGIEWAVSQGVQVINLSIGGRDLPDVGDEGPVLDNDLEEAITEAARAGVITVVSVGNSYVLSSELNTPANGVEALVVGAAAADGTPKAPPVFANGTDVGVNSSRDTTFSDLDPHVTAVGSLERVMARAAGTDMGGKAAPANPDGSPNADGPCVRAAGTSFAAPWAAGFMARLRRGYGGDASGTALVGYLVRLVQWSAVDTSFPYPVEGFGFVEASSVVGAALGYAAAGRLPPTPEPNESFRQVSDTIRAVY